MAEVALIELRRLYRRNCVVVAPVLHALQQRMRVFRGACSDQPGTLAAWHIVHLARDQDDRKRKGCARCSACASEIAESPSHSIAGVIN